MSNCRRRQTHVHEFLGSTQLAEEEDNNFGNQTFSNREEEECHNHRFAGMTGEAIPTNNGRSHYHLIETRTDFFDDHFHEINVATGPAIPVGDGRHVHFVEGTTRTRDGHEHDFRLATLIENPIEGNDEDC